MVPAEIVGRCLTWKISWNIEFINNSAIPVLKHYAMKIHQLQQGAEKHLFRQPTENEHCYTNIGRKRVRFWHLIQVRNRWKCLV